MWLTATALFIGSPLVFREPISLKSNFPQSFDNPNLRTSKSIIFASSQYLGADKISPSATDYNLARDKPSLVSSLTLNNKRANVGNIENNAQDYLQPESPNFKPGAASWKSNTAIGSLKFDGQFDSQANLKQGNAFWQTETKLGSVDFAINLDNKIKPIKSTAAWQAKTKLGSLAVRGNFDRQNQYSGSNAAWQAKTQLGSLSVQGNFDRETTFVGSDVKLSTKTVIGSLAADVRLDEQTQFKSATASWDTNLPLQSSLGVSSEFGDNTDFTGGSIKLGTKTALGLLGIKANLDRQTSFTGGSAFWKIKTDVGSINLNADVDTNGDLESGFNLERSF